MASVNQKILHRIRITIESIIVPYEKCFKLTQMLKDSDRERMEEHLSGWGAETTEKDRLISKRRHMKLEKRLV